MRCWRNGSGWFPSPSTRVCCAIEVRPTRASHAEASDPDPDALPTDRDTVVFRLTTKCTRVKDVDPGERDPLKLYKNAHGTTAVVTPC